MLFVFALIYMVVGIVYVTPLAVIGSDYITSHINENDMDGMTRLMMGVGVLVQVLLWPLWMIYTIYVLYIES